MLTALQAEGGPLAQAIEASEQIEEAARKVTAAEHELDLFVTNPQLLTTIGQEKFMQGSMLASARSTTPGRISPRCAPRALSRVSCQAAIS